MNAAALPDTTCPYCGVGCGVRPQAGPGGDIIAVSGVEDHPANLGRLCVKGAALHETLSNEGRLNRPRVDGQSLDWPEALDTVAGRLQAIIDRHGPDSVAFYLSGQLLTEDYYVANKLMKGFIGSANVDTNSRLCMASAVVGYKRAFGSDTVPCNFEDLELCDLLVMVGSNAAWTHPVLYQRIAKAKEQRPEMKVVVVDTRRTATCDLADLVLNLRPGTDAWLFNGLLRHLHRSGLADNHYIRNHTDYFDAALQAAGDADPDRVAQLTGLEPGDLQTFYQWFAETDKTVSFYSQGVNQSSSGSDKCNAIINCHLATGRIGRPGMGPFSITGQPNAMGGREVGGLATQLAAHMDFAPEHVERVGRFWQAPKTADKPGLKAVDLFDAIEEGRIKAVWIMATNPVVSLPNAERVRAALKQCDLVIVSDCVAQTDTSALADILLPATGWGEKDGTVTNSERCISRQRPIVRPHPGARHDWWIVTQVARRLGFAEAFPYQGPRDIFVEHAALSGLENRGSRDFDISGLQDLSDAQYDKLQPLRWPVNADHPRGTPRIFADGKFFTASGRARFVAIEPRLPQYPAGGQFPLVLNTGRIRDQWHTMTRTGKAPRLLNHIDGPRVSLHPLDAEPRGITENHLVRVFNDLGEFTMLADLDDRQPRGQVFAPIHWNAQFASDARVGVLIPPVTDPHSGQPESKAAPVQVAAHPVASWISLVTSEPLDLPPGQFWYRVPLKAGWRYELACETARSSAKLLGSLLRPTDRLVQFADDESGDYRHLAFADGVLRLAVFAHHQRSSLPDRTWLSSLENRPYDTDAWQWLSGRDATGEDPGRMICSCYEVGEKQILNAIRQGACSPKELGASLRCGTNCGSCIPELQQLVDAQKTEEEAA